MPERRERQRTLWVPGQVVGDGVEEELPRLLPLVVKLLLAAGKAAHHAMLAARVRDFNHCICPERRRLPCGACLGW